MSARCYRLYPPPSLSLSLFSLEPLVNSRRDITEQIRRAWFPSLARFHHRHRPRTRFRLFFWYLVLGTRGLRARFSPALRCETPRGMKCPNDRSGSGRSGRVGFREPEGGRTRTRARKIGMRMNRANEKKEKKKRKRERYATAIIVCIRDAIESK